MVAYIVDDTIHSIKFIFQIIYNFITYYKIMNYHCPLCDGSYFRCGKIHDYCIRCVACKHCQTSTCKCLECDVSGHLQSSCPGGKFCWEESVCCVIQHGYESDIGKSFYGKYDGSGYVIPEISSNYKYINYDLYNGSDIPVKIMCKSCYIKLLSEYEDLKHEIIEMENDLKVMSIEEKDEYQSFVNDLEFLS